MNASHAEEPPIDHLSTDQADQSAFSDASMTESIEAVLHGMVLQSAQPVSRQSKRHHLRWRWRRPTLIHWMGLFVLLVMSCGFLFGAPVLKTGEQQQTLTFKTGAGSVLMPTPTPTTPPPTATPAPRPTQPPSSGGGSVIGIIQAVFGSYSNAAITVARCESSLNPSAINPTSIGGSHAEGLFQILYPSTWGSTSQAGNSPYDAQSNTLAAYEIFQRDGYSWREWSCQP